EGHPDLFAPVDSFPAREAGFEVVPVLDALLADPPAQLDLAAPAKGAEVEEPRIEILDDRAERVELAHAVCNVLGEAFELRPRRVQSLRGATVAVSGDRGHVRRLRRKELAHPRSRRDEPLCDGPHLYEGAVSLGGSEEASGHG